MRGVVHKIHRWAGLSLCLPLVTLGLSGSILVFQHELGDPHYTIAQGKPHSVGEILEAGQAAAPHGFSPAMFRAGKPGEPVTLFLAPEHKSTTGGQGRKLQMLIDPVSLSIVNPDASHSLMRQILQFHSSLMLRDYGGRSVVGWFGVIMLAFGISGLVLWWPRRGNWRQAFIVKRGARGFRLYRDLHGAVGIWGFIVFIAVSFSGVCLAFPQTMDAAIGSVFPARDLRAPPSAKIEPIKNQTPMTVDDAVALAQESVKAGSLLSATLPAKSDQPYRITFARADDKEGAPPVNLFIDPWAKQIIEVRDPHDYSTGETIIAWQHALHSGQGLGWVWKLLVFTVGLMPLLFAYTGISMWLVKRRLRSSSIQ